MKEDPAHLAELIAAADWDRITRRALVWAQVCLFLFGRRHGPRGKTPDDYVMEAVIGILEGRHAVGKFTDVLRLTAAIILRQVREDMKKVAS